VVRHQFIMQVITQVLIDK